MPRENQQSASQEVSSPDYVGLVEFLLKPFLEESESLHVNCESLSSTGKVWLRVAFNTADKGKVFGRGGRNIQAVRTILKTAAVNANQSLHLDIYNSNSNSNSNHSTPRIQRDRGEGKPKAPERKSNRPRPEKK